MKIKFIGTGSAKTSLNRFHSSFLINSSEHKLLVDCGDGISRALLTNNVDFNSINSIIISHLHSDHYTGLPSLITQMKLNNRNEKLSLFIHKPETGFIKQFLQNSYLFSERLPFELEIIPFSTEEKIYITEHLNITTKCNSHLEKYRVIKSFDNLSYTSLSFLFNDQENSVIYTGDIGSEDDLFLFQDEVDWFITETTHIKPKSLIKLINKNLAKKVIITHIDNLSVDFDEILNRKLSDSNYAVILFAFDGLELNHYRFSCL